MHLIADVCVGRCIYKHICKRVYNRNMRDQVHVIPATRRNIFVFVCDVMRCVF